MKRSMRKTTVMAGLSRQHSGNSVAEIISSVNSPQSTLGGSSLYEDFRWYVNSHGCRFMTPTCSCWEGTPSRKSQHHGEKSPTRRLDHRECTVQRDRLSECHFVRARLVQLGANISRNRLGFGVIEASWRNRKLFGAPFWVPWSSIPHFGT